MVPEYSLLLVLILTNFLIFIPFSVSLSDPLFSLYNDWIWDITIMTLGLMIFYGALIFYLYLTIKGKWSGLVMALTYHFSITYLCSISCKAPLSACLLAQGSSSFQRGNNTSPQICFVKLYIYILRLRCLVSSAQRVTLLLSWLQTSSALYFSYQHTEPQVFSQICHCPPAACRSVLRLTPGPLAP